MRITTLFLYTFSVCALLYVGIQYWHSTAVSQTQPTAIPPVKVGPISGEQQALEGISMLPDFVAGNLSDEILQKDTPLVLNFFASWCAPCKIEHPLLLDLKDKGVAVYGIAFRDNKDSVAKYLTDEGNPYRRYGIDTGGESGIAWGVKGIPETFVIDKNGRIKWRWSGPLKESHVDKITKHIVELRAQ